jgi:hypothetical protein
VDRSRVPKAICLVTHNIEEAIVLADCVIVLSSSPGRILTELPIDLERPRDRRSPSFEALVDKIYGLLTGAGAATTLVEPATATPTSHPLPHATVGGLAGLVEIVYGNGGRVDIPHIAADLSIDAKDLLPLVDAAALLDFVRVSGADLELTPVGKDFTTAGIQVSKRFSPSKHAPVRRWYAPFAMLCTTARTAPCGPGSSSTSFSRGSVPLMRNNNSTSPSAGADMRSCSTTTPIPTRSPPKSKLNFPRPRSPSAF